MLAVISYRPSVIRSILRLYGVHSELPRFLLAYCAFSSSRGADSFWLSMCQAHRTHHIIAMCQPNQCHAGGF